jgi:hypothetical protein
MYRSLTALRASVKLAAAETFNSTVVGWVMVGVGVDVVTGVGDGFEVCAGVDGAEDVVAGAEVVGVVSSAQPVKGTINRAHIKMAIISRLYLIFINSPFKHPGC